MISQISLSSIAIYSLGYRIYEASSHLARFLIYPRWLYLALDNYEKTKKIHDLYKYVIVISTLIAISLTIISEDIVKIMLDKRYFNCWVLIPLISFMVLFNNLRNFWINFIVYNKQKAFFLLIHNFFCFSSIVLMLILYQYFDIFGIGLAMLLSSIISLIVTLYYVKKLKYEIRNKYIFIF